jgi:hypothetical protein
MTSTPVDGSSRVELAVNGTTHTLPVVAASEGNDGIVVSSLLKDTGLVTVGPGTLASAAGAWQAEWVAIPSAMVRTIGAVERLGAAVEMLEVDPDRGQHNLAANLHLAASEALVVALSEPLGRPRAGALVADLVARAVEQRRDLAEVAAEDHRVTSALASERLTEAMDARRSIATAGAWIDAALDRHRALVADREAT